MTGPSPPVVAGRVEYEADSGHGMARSPRTPPAARRGSPSARGHAARARLTTEIEEQWCRLSSAMTAFQARRAEQRGLTLDDLQAVDVLGQEDGVCASDLAEACGLTRGAVTGLLDRLERAGVARRRRDEDDGRRLVIQATEPRPGCDCRLPGGLRAVLASFDEATLREIGRFLDESARVLRRETRLLDTDE